MSGVEEGISGGQGAPWWTLGAGLASLFVARSLKRRGWGAKTRACPLQLEEEMPGGLHVPVNAGGSRARKTQPQNGVCMPTRDIRIWNFPALISRLENLNVTWSRGALLSHRSCCCFLQRG